MGSLAQPSVPVIDLSQEECLKAGTTAWTKKCNAVRHALEEYGYFQVVYKKLSLKLHDKVFDAVEELFNLPTQVKIKNTSEKPYHGYYGQYPFIPLYESLAIDNTSDQQVFEHFTKTMWPDGNVNFCELMRLYAKIVTKLDQMVTRMVFDSYGVESYYEPHKKSTNYLLRCFKYRIPKEGETNLGLNAHTDKSFTSILHQNNVNGLEIKTKDGEWMSLELLPSSFLFIAGDALKVWSNDRIRSCEHRVTMKAKTTRYSLGMFSFNTGMIHVPQELGNDNSPLKYKSFDHYGFLRFHQTEEGKKSECPIRAYCGV